MILEGDKNRRTFRIFDEKMGFRQNLFFLSLGKCDFYKDFRWRDCCSNIVAMQHAWHLLCVAAVALSALSACNEVMAYQAIMQTNDIKMNIAPSLSQARLRRCEASRGLHANLSHLRHKMPFPGMSILLSSMSYVKATPGASVEMRAAEKKPDTSPPLSQTINKPPVSIEEGGYRAPDELRTWKEFSYCAPEVKYYICISMCSWVYVHIGTHVLIHTHTHTKHSVWYIHIHTNMYYMHANYHTHINLYYMHMFAYTRTRGRTYVCTTGETRSGGALCCKHARTK